MKKILLVQTQAENAGAQEVARQLASGLERRGWHASQIFFFRRTKAFDDTEKVFFCAMQRPSTFFGLVKLLQELYQIIRREKPEAVVTFQHYGNLIAAPVARLAGVRLVVANHVSTRQHSPRSVQIADLIIGMAGAYDKIVVNSAVTESTYKHYPSVYRQKLLRIDHGFFDKAIQLDREEARSVLALPSKVPLIGCAARLHPLKQLDLAIRTLAINIDHHFAIAGQGPQLAELQALAEKSGAKDRVHFLGELSTEEMGTFLATLDCFVFPSCSESFGLAPVEAAQAGLPVIANDLPVLRDVLAVDGKACALFIDANNIDTFAKTISLVLHDKALADDLSATGMKLKSRFPLEKMIDEYCAILETKATDSHAS